MRRRFSVVLPPVIISSNTAEKRLRRLIAHALREWCMEARDSFHAVKFESKKWRLIMCVTVRLCYFVKNRKLSVGRQKIYTGFKQVHIFSLCLLFNNN